MMRSSIRKCFATALLCTTLAACTPPPDAHEPPKLASASAAQVGLGPEGMIADMGFALLKAAAGEAFKRALFPDSSLDYQTLNQMFKDAARQANIDQTIWEQAGTLNGFLQSMHEKEMLSSPPSYTEVDQLGSVINTIMGILGTDAIAKQGLATYIAAVQAKLSWIGELMQLPDPLAVARKADNARYLADQLRAAIEHVRSTKRQIVLDLMNARVADVVCVPYIPYDKVVYFNIADLEVPGFPSKNYVSASACMGSNERAQYINQLLGNFPATQSMQALAWIDAQVQTWQATREALLEDARKELEAARANLELARKNAQPAQAPEDVVNAALAAEDRTKAAKAALDACRDKSKVPALESTLKQANLDRFDAWDRVYASVPGVAAAEQRYKAAQTTARDLTAIEMVSATYGQNLNVTPNNALPFLADTCDGLGSCSFPINRVTLLEPWAGQGKDFHAEYECYDEGQPATSNPRIDLPADADGKTAALDCRTPRLQIAGVNATYGVNCGVPLGQDSWRLATVCDGVRSSCAVHAGPDVFGDNAPGCAKDLLITYTCRDRGWTVNKTVLVSDGQTAMLSCDDTRVAP